MMTALMQSGRAWFVQRQQQAVQEETHHQKDIRETHKAMYEGNTCLVYAHEDARVKVKRKHRRK